MSFIYNLIVILLLGSTIYQVRKDEDANRRWFNMIVILMMGAAGLAYGISPDWVAYWNAFEGIAQSSWAELPIFSEMVDMEMGYVVLNKLVNTIGLGYASFTLIIAIIALWLKSGIIYKYGGYAFMSLLMYFIPTYLFEEHVHVRQGLANAIMFFSIPFIIERKFWKFFMCFVLAFLFHKAVLAFLLAYWIVKIKFNSLTIVLLVVAAVLANVTGLSGAIDGIMQFMPFGVAETYNDYANELSSDGGVLGDIVKILTVLAIVVFNKSVTENDPLFIYFRNIYLFGVVIYFFFGNGIFAARLPGFFTVYIIFVVPRMVKALQDNKLYKNIVYIAFTTYTLLLYINFYNNWGSRSGFGNYTSSLNTWVPYGFLSR
ncbi:EpsG family protein [Moheibacter lacus]|uniref:EpsG family protein n=1 Tax=Moheibacter lacus TaxID=2745851 RepID=A0A838ZNU0_9FLAO|nr:EpsG family protein [Moheibacter lacus]MBA5628385.1 EpsG family protein [Moheibacter lacus]